MHFRRTLLFILCTLVSSLFLGTYAAQAQYSEYTISATPLNPAPGQTVALELISISSDVNKAEVSWYDGNKIIQKGTGLSKINYQAPASGSASTISTVISRPDGTTAQTSLTLRVGEVNITWETDGYVPPFYRGRAPYTYQSNLKLVALPNLYDSAGNYISPSNLTYRWKKDSTVLGNNSGFNKQSLILKGEIVPRPMTITVDVESRDGKTKGQGIIAIDAIEPQVLLYEDDPLYGPLYQSALGSKYTINSERKLIAEPYFFSTNNKAAPRLRYTWSINNLEATDIQNNTSIVLRPKGDVEGSSYVTLRVDNLSDILQSASRGVQVYFSKVQEQTLPIF